MWKGFDLYIYADKIGFLMEKCEHVKPKISINEDIGEGLLKLHNLQIIHRDVKPSNVMFSRKRKKHVLIDFGMTLAIKQNFGKLTLTGFAGTYTYCCQELKKLYNLEKAGLVDLYYNDMYALKITNKNCMKAIDFFQRKIE